MTRDRVAYRALVCLAVAGLLVHGVLLARYTVDDAFISFRYARNLVEGHGLVFNVGERVEGYTNFLWTMLHALVIRFGGNPELLAKILGLGSAFGTLTVILALGRAWGHARMPFDTLGVLYWASAGAVAITAVNGLETHFFTLTVSLGVLAYARSKDQPRPLFLAITFLSVSTLIRPDGWGVLGVTLGHHYLSRRGRASLAPLLLAVLVAGPHLIWRYSYYDSFVPNTFGAKTGGGIPQVLKGLDYLKSFVNEYGKPALYLLAALPFLRAPLGLQRSHALSLLVAYLAYVVIAGGDWIPHFRFLVPVMPILAVALQDGLRSLRSLLPPGPGRRGLVASAVIWGFVVIILFDIANQTYYLRLHTEMWASGYHHAHRRVGLWLKDNASPDDTVALMDIGIIGYVSRLRVVDITGLTDPHVAASPGGWLKKTYSLDYLFDMGPEYFVLVSSTNYPRESFGSSFPIDRALFEDPRLHHGYRFLFSADAYVTRQPHTSGYYLLLFQRMT